MDKSEIFSGISLGIGECLKDVDVCSPKEIQDAMQSMTNEQTPISALNKLKDETGCKTESCVLKKKFSNNVVNSILETRFKAEGPKNSTQLLSNFNIDNTLTRWALEFDFFFPCPFAMMDFDNTHEPFSIVSIPDVYMGEYVMKLSGKHIKRKNKCFGCIINTDISTGPGKHWTAAFVDMRSNVASIEYFNSVANPPVKAITIWMERTKNDLMKSGLFSTVISIPVTTIDHQQDDTECGVYSLYYIRCRLEGKPYTFFQDKPISDKFMIEFRKYLFR